MIAKVIAIVIASCGFIASLILAIYSISLSHKAQKHAEEANRLLEEWDRAAERIDNCYQETQADSLLQDCDKNGGNERADSD